MRGSLLHFVVWHKTDSGKAGVILYSTQEMKRKSGGRIKRGGVGDSEQEEIITQSVCEPFLEVSRRR